MMKKVKIVLSVFITLFLLKTTGVSAFEKSVTNSIMKDIDKSIEISTDASDSKETTLEAKIKVPKNNNVSTYYLSSSLENKTVSPGSTVTIKYPNDKKTVISVYGLNSSNNQKEEIGGITLNNGELEDGWEANVSTSRDYKNAKVTVKVSLSEKAKTVGIKYYAYFEKKSSKLIDSNSPISISKTLKNKSTDILYIEIWKDNSLYGTQEVNLTGFQNNKVYDNKKCDTIRSNNLYKKNPSNYPQCYYKWVDYGMQYDEDDLDDIISFMEAGISTNMKFGDVSLDDEKQKDVTPESNKFTCQFNKNANQKGTYTHWYTKKTSYKYFDVICKETVKITYDSPKLVSNNGGGFEYDVKVTPTISCYAKANEKAEELLTRYTAKKCNTHGSCWGTYDHGRFAAGPSEEFDTCVYKCDKGEYSQKCINKCYNEVYESTSSTDYTSIGSNNTVLLSNTKKSTLGWPYSGATIHTSDASLESYKKDWCVSPPSGKFTGWSSDTRAGNDYKISGHSWSGSYRCVYYTDKNDKVKFVDKFWRSAQCDSTCYYTLESNGKSKQFKLNSYGKMSGITTDDTGLVTTNELNCYLNSNGKNISANKEALKKLKQEVDKVKKEVKDYNNGPITANYSKDSKNKATYEYVIHDSQESYCNDDNKKNNAVTYSESKKDTPLIVDTESSKTDIKLSFPNTCFKNGNYKNKSGCCNLSSDGMTGGNKFYMAITTETNINNVYNWPTNDEEYKDKDGNSFTANFTDEESATIKAARANVQSFTKGKVYVWDINDHKRKNKCNENGTRFDYNINASLENLGEGGNWWDFDIQCFYGYFAESSGTCGRTVTDEDTDGDGEPDTNVVKDVACSTDDSSSGTSSSSTKTTNLVSKYIYRTVDLTDLFTDTIPWNWTSSETTKAATNLLSTIGIKTYKIDPINTIAKIEETKYAYTSLDNYTFNVSSTQMKKIKSYNNDNKEITFNKNCITSSSKVGCSNNFITNTQYAILTKNSKLTSNLNNIRDAS